MEVKCKGKERKGKEGGAGITVVIIICIIYHYDG